MAVHAKLTAPIRPCAVFSKMKLEEVNARTKEAVDFLVAALETGHKWVLTVPRSALYRRACQVAKRWCSAQRVVRSEGRRFSPLPVASSKPDRRSPSIGFLRDCFVHSTLTGAVIDPMRPLRLSRTTMRTVYSPAASSSAPRNPTPFSLTFVSSSGEG